MKWITDNRPGRPGRGGALALAMAMVLACVVVFVTGCAARDEDDSFLSTIAQGGDNQEWDALRPEIKTYLLRNPYDSLGHYIYGLSYLHMASPQLTLAEGEFLTARVLLDANEQFSEAETGMDRGNFAGQIHRKVALVYMRGYREAIRLGLPRNYAMDLLKKANAQVDLGLKESPDSVHLQDVSKFLRGELEMDVSPAPEIITERAGSGVSI